MARISCEQEGTGTGGLEGGQQKVSRRRSIHVEKNQLESLFRGEKKNLSIARKRGKVTELQWGENLKTIAPWPCAIKKVLSRQGKGQWK